MNSFQAFQYVANSQINKSKSKETHAFSKTSRFPKTQQSPCLQSSYNISKSMLQLSKSQFTKQDRFKEDKLDLARKSFSPSPNTYRTESFVDLSLKQSHGSKFRRQKRLKTAANDAPGPGKYNCSTYNPEVSLSYTMRNKPKTDSTHWNKVGPAQYNNHNSINPEGSYFNSKYSNSKCSKIGTSKRFKTSYDESPAPNTYGVDKYRREASSKFSNTDGYSFGKQKKKGFYQGKQTPGPGSYMEFSQFSEGSKRILERLARI